MKAIVGDESTNSTGQVINARTYICMVQVIHMRITATRKQLNLPSQFIIWSYVTYKGPKETVIITPTIENWLRDDEVIFQEDNTACY